jgi:WD40 repeat protein
MVFDPAHPRLLLSIPGKLLLLDLPRGRDVWALPLTQEVWDVAPNGNQALSIRLPGGRRIFYVDVWDLVHGRLSHSLEAGFGAGEVWRPSFDPSGRHVAAVVQEEHPRLMIWELPSGKRLAKKKIPHGKRDGVFKGSQVLGAEISPDHRLLATSSKHSLRLWSLPGLEHLGALPWEEPIRATFFAFSPDARLLAVLGYSRKPTVRRHLLIYDLSGGDILFWHDDLSANYAAEDQPAHVSFSSEGRLLILTYALGGSMNELQINVMDWQDWRVKCTLPGSGAAPRLAPGGRALAVATRLSVGVYGFVE